MDYDSLEQTIFYAGATTTILSITTPTIISYLRKRNKARDAVRENYSCKKGFLEKEISLLEKDFSEKNTGNSPYENREYMEIVLNQHKDNCREALMQDIPKEDRKILGEDFLREYSDKAKKLIGLVSRFQPKLEQRFYE